MNVVFIGLNVYDNVINICAPERDEIVTKGRNVMHCFFFLN